MNYPAASGWSINPKKQKQDTPQAAGELTQKILNVVSYYLYRKKLMKAMLSKINTSIRFPQK